jgi:hypothetical protein
MLTVETEENGDGVHMKGSFLVGWLSSLCRFKRFLSYLGCSSRPSTKYVFLTAHNFTSFVPIAQQPGQAVVACLLICVSSYSCSLM